MRKAKKRALYAALLLAVFCLTGAAALAARTASAAGGPIAQSLTLETFAGVPVTGSLSALDPEGRMLTFRLEMEPKKGTVELSEDGSFTYTPKKGKSGKDTFTFTVSAGGTTSAPATVTVELRRRKDKTTYADMEGNPACYAALVLAEEGLFSGDRVAGVSLFRPEATLSRSEFLALCLAACGAEVTDTVLRTGFYDDEAIPAWAKPYVAAALMGGVVEGKTDDRGLPVFDPDAPVTRAEAAVILSGCMNVSDVTWLTLASEDCPDWAYQSAVNLVSCGVMPAASPGDYSQALTRAEAARMLVGAMETLQARSGRR